MTKDEALKLALEALEEIQSYYGHDRSVGALSSSMYEASNLAKITSAAIREALAQSEQEPLAWLIWLHGPAGHFDHKQFAEMEFERRNKEYPDPDRKLLSLYTTPPSNSMNLIKSSNTLDTQRKPLSLAELFLNTPQRKPLSDEQWQVIADTLDCLITRKQKDAIEAVIGIKD